MKLSPQQYAQALLEAIEGTKPTDHDKVMDNFVKILAQNGDLNKHEAIQEEFRKLTQMSKGIHEAEVSTAHKVEYNKDLLDDLNTIFHHKVELKEKVDQDLVGGIIIKVDDQLIDASVKGKLDRLNQELKS